MALTDQDQRQRRPRGPIRRLLSFIAMTVRTVLLLPPKYGPHLPQKEARQLAFALVMMVGFVLMASAGRSTDSALASHELYYSDFLRLVNSKDVALARIDEAAGRIYFSLRPEAMSNMLGSMADSVSASATEAAPSVFFFTRRINDPTLIPSLLAAGVKFAAIQANLRRSIGTLLMTTLALWLPLLPMFFFLWRAVQSRTGASRSKKDTTKASTPPVTFRDVAGVDTAKEELLEVVACLRDSSRYAQLNARMPPGVLLTGVPGTGKTLLAKAVAGEAGVPFFAASASEFVELFVGRGAARIRDLFAEARKHAPCVVFIDELDAIGGRRGLGLNEERDQTLNQLLTELDGFEARPGVLLLAATNRTEVLDPALLRPGRLSRRVTIPLPDETGRANILAVHLRSTPMLSDQDRAVACEQIARLTSGFSGAELANVVNEAALLTGRDGRKVVTIQELLKGIQRTKYGIEGGTPAFSPFKSLQRRLLDWSASAVSSSRSQQARSMGSPS
ncbi:hypothetical protein WJX74_009843 [Apatococcus lobatus]|uniref:AAA+ ATPase domain-containing protein n=1 Tax=Apatococcus lobatus TaxID=904363 RepID=A0AAW1R2X9_9CHLO